MSPPISTTVVGNRSWRRGAILTTALAMGTWPVLSCALSNGDPVHQAAVDALGPEVPGVPQGEFHRAGQPCTVCHSTEGPARAVFSLAGTVFAATSGNSSQAKVGVEDAGVGIVDTRGVTFLAATNCVGNFFVAPDDYSPTFPLRVAVSKGMSSAQMITHISRETSCANCHFQTPNAESTAQVFLSTADVPMDCPVRQGN